MSMRVWGVWLGHGWCADASLAHTVTLDSGRPLIQLMLHGLFSMPNAGGSFKAVVSGLGPCVLGITLPSGILMSNLCCQTASSRFPPHIFLNLRLFCCFCHPKPIPSLSSLLPCTVNCCTLEYTPSNVASTTHSCKLSLSFSPLPGYIGPPFPWLYFFNCIFCFISSNKGILFKRGTEKRGGDGQRKR